MKIKIAILILIIGISIVCIVPVYSDYITVNPSQTIFVPTYPSNDNALDFGSSILRWRKSYFVEVHSANYYAGATAPVTDGTYAFYNNGTSGQVINMTFTGGICTNIAVIP